MALKKTVTTIHGFLATDAYHRIENLSISPNLLVDFDSVRTITFVVRSYKTSDAICFFENSFGCEYNIDGENPIKQAYEYVKTLPEFADAQDC